MYRGLFEKTHFTVVVSYSEDKAKVFTGRLLLELKYNRRICNDFNIKFLKDEIGNIQFSVGKWKVCIKAFSVGQNVRGEVFYNFRPDTVRLDDIQDRKRAKSKKFVDNCIEWIFADLLPALNPKKYSCIVVATPMNSKCVVSELKNGDDEKERSPLRSFSYPAIDKNGKATWPSRFPLEVLEKLKKFQGSLFFNQEYLLIPIKDGDRTFQEAWIKYYVPSYLENKVLPYVLSWTDSSLTAKGDYKATVCGASDGIDIFILKSRVRKESVSKMLDGMYSIHRECNPSLMFYEDYTDKEDNQTILQESIEAKEFIKGYSLPLRAERNSINKELRIEGTLSAEIENGHIYFLEGDRDQKLIVKQLTDFPDGENDDGADALEGLVRKLREYIRRSKRYAKMKAPKVKRVRRKSAIIGDSNYE